MDVAEDVSPDERRIVDWFHAVQHVADAAQTLYPNDVEITKRKCWLTTYKSHLYMGRVHKIMTV